MSNISKYVFGKTKLGRMKRTVECDSTTFDGVSWIPNFKGSQRGAVLKVTNDILLSHGMRKRSQIDSINGDDISTLPFKRIKKAIDAHIDSDEPFSASFMIPEQDVITVEVYFRGKFCFDYIDFSCDENDNNFIISSINYAKPEAIKMTEKSNIKIGYRVTKVKGIKVINKKYAAIKKMITSASNDMRVDYAVLFEEGELDWYNIKKPPTKNAKSPHVKYSKSVANLTFNPYAAQKRRKSGNIPTQSSRNTLRPKTKHIKKGKSYDFNANDEEDLMVSPVALRRNISGNKRKAMKPPKQPAPKAPKGSKTSKTSKTPNTPKKTKRSSKIFAASIGLKIGKIAFNTCKLGLTRREIECDSETFMDADLVPNFKGSQRGAVLKRTNDTLLRNGFIKKTSIQSINGHDVSSASYQNIVEALNEYISEEQLFTIAFQIPEREVKTVEIFFRGSIVEHFEFVADDKGNNCIIKRIKTGSDIGKTLKNKCALSPGYRVTKVKTTKVINKKFDDIYKNLVQSSKDMRVQYLVVFEEGELGWYGIDANDLEIIKDNEQPPRLKPAIQSSKSMQPPAKNKSKPWNPPKPISARTPDPTGSVKVTQYAITTDTPFDSDDADNSGSGYNSGFEGSDPERSLVVLSSEEDDDDIKEPEPSAGDKSITTKTSTALRQSVSEHEDDNKLLQDIAMAVTDERAQEKEEKQEKEEEEEDIEEKRSKNENKMEEEEEEETKIKRTAKKKQKKDIWDDDDKRNKNKNNVIRQRFIARVKNVCIAAPFDPNQTLLEFKKEILSKIARHVKLKRDKNLSKRIKYIKLQTPAFPMLIDCNAKDRLCEIATRKDMIVLHTQSDDDMEYEQVYD